MSDPSKSNYLMLGLFIIILSQLDSHVRLQDLNDLYARLAQRLERIVRLEVRAPDAVIEDACQFAWGRLADHAGRVRTDAVLTWLAKTAIHEALKLLRHTGRNLSLELAAEEEPAVLARAVAPSPHELFEHRERLAEIGALPDRQQRMLWLLGIGLSYADIAARTGCTSRTVERQLLRARRTLRNAETDADADVLAA
jgi:RNA polymerase sigma factor (sigma-70 family)